MAHQPSPAAEPNTVTIDPFAAAAHLRAAKEYFESRCMLLQNTVVKQEMLIAGLNETIAQRDAEIARLDADREPIADGGEVPGEEA